MFVQVDLAQTPPRVTLEEPDDTRQFHLAVRGGSGGDGSDVAMVYGALVDAAAGRLEGSDAWIGVDAVRRMAAGRVDAGWDDALAAMLEYARSKGWMDDAGNAVKAHVEWTT
jgi:hypothetical protein